jgi:hypothetical protein
MKLRLTLALAVLALAAEPLSGLSVLSHEAVIDIAWDSDILPTILKRYPDATPDQIKEARAFAYGGSVVQDLGYYPLGNELFTNLVHYARTGDFVASLIREARNINEYAFAIGALSHYATDSWGHAAVNLAVPIAYPKLQQKFGDWVTYEDHKESHLKTEFSFDVLQVAQNRYTAQEYHDFIGFEVSEEQLERAFLDTYGIPMDELLHYDDLTLATFRFAVSKVVPEMTQVALATNKPQLSSERETRAKKDFVYRLSRTQYEREFGNRYRRPGFFARVLGFLIKLFPFGPAKILGYRNPTPVTQDYYFRAMDKALAEYHGLMQQVRAGDLDFPNRNFDTGRVIREGEYALGDRTYVALVRHLERDHYRHLTAAVKANVLAYFSEGMPANGSIKAGDWKKVQATLLQLETQATVAPQAIAAGER